MSKDKNKQQQRYLALLDKAARKNGKIPLNCEGGLPMNDRDLQKALSEHLFTIERHTYSGSLSSRNLLRRTYAIITKKGQDLLNQHKEKIS